MNFASLFGMTMGGKCRTEFGKWILAKLGSDYMVGQDDTTWLDTVGNYWDSARTKASAKEAVKKALEEHPRGHIDPYELVLDAFSK